MSIPRQDELLLSIATRTASVLGGGLPTETHGKDRVAFHELRVVVWLDTPEEINEFLDPKVTILPRPYDLIFNGDGNIHQPDATLEFEVRSGITGALTLKGTGKPMDFAHARTVGGANKLTFSNGGRAKLALTMRFDAGAMAARVVELINRGECDFAFQEDTPEESPIDQEKRKLDEAQGELKV